MQGKTVKSVVPGTRGNCTDGGNLSCSSSMQLGQDTCTSTGTLGVCQNPKNLNSKGATRATGACCGEGHLTMAASLSFCGTDQSLCNHQGETLQM